MFRRAKIFHGLSFLFRGRRSATGAPRSTRGGWRATLVAVGALITLSSPRANTISVDVDQLAQIRLAVAAQSYETLPIHASSRARRLRCRSVIPPQTRCIWQRPRFIRCCTAGSSGSAASGDFGGGVQSDLGMLGFHMSALGSEGGVGGGGAAGGGAGGNSRFSATVGEAGDMPPISSVPGPIAGAGVPGLLVLLGSLAVRWRLRRNVRRLID
jgi:hypothetical protein